jgi:hypothetical protein
MIQAYTLRWLVEVFFEDWKLYKDGGVKPNNWMKKDQARGDLIPLSLLFDHCLPCGILCSRFMLEK